MIGSTPIWLRQKFLMKCLSWVSVCCNVLQCVLQCVAVRVAVCCSACCSVCCSVCYLAVPFISEEVSLLDLSVHSSGSHYGGVLPVAVCCSVLQCVAVCCSVLQSSALCCSVCYLAVPVISDQVSPLGLSSRALFRLGLSVHPSGSHCGGFLPVAVCCSVLQCVAVCCRALQWVLFGYAGHFLSVVSLRSLCATLGQRLQCLLTCAAVCRMSEILMYFTAWYRVCTFLFFSLSTALHHTGREKGVGGGCSNRVGGKWGVIEGSRKSGETDVA